MFYTLSKIHTLLLDADDLQNHSAFVKAVIAALEPTIQVKLVSRHHDSPQLFHNRTFVPHTMSEHRSFSMLLERVIKQSEAPPFSIVYLCGTVASLERVKHFLFGTVYFAPEPLTDHEKHLLYQESPDFVIDSIEDLLRCLSITVLGYAGEVASDESRLIANPFAPKVIAPAPITTTAAAPTLLNSIATASASAVASSSSIPDAPSLSKSDARHSNFISADSSDTVVKIIRLPNHAHPKSPYWTCGRYFGNSDPRHQLHPLSIRLWDFKKHHSLHAQLFANLYINAIHHATDGELDIITQVPCRPEAEDRLGVCLTAMNSNTSSENTQLIDPNVLRCVNMYPIKSMSAQSRKTTAATAFQVQKNISGKRVVIIDDIVTTGATMNACIAQLTGAGALSVTPVLLAYHPYAIRSNVFASQNTHLVQ